MLRSKFKVNCALGLQLVRCSQQNQHADEEKELAAVRKLKSWHPLDQVLLEPTGLVKTETCRHHGSACLGGHDNLYVASQLLV